VALAGFGLAAVVIAVMGVRLTRYSAGPVSGDAVAQPAGSAGLDPVAPQSPPAGGAGPAVPVGPSTAVRVTQGAGGAPVITLTLPMDRTPPPDLRAYQLGRREGQRAWFLVHTLGRPSRTGQRYSVALKVVPHDPDTAEPVVGARFYLGRSWGNRVLPAQRGDDGYFGLVTEAYGAFLALCEIEFADGRRLLLDRYCDFAMGDLVPR